MKDTKFDDFDLERQTEELKKIVWDLKERTDKNLGTIASNYVAITKINKTVDKLKMNIKKLWGAVKELRREVREKEPSIF
jgi:peptidoglycan hydrolase CwlO-like protein